MAAVMSTADSLLILASAAIVKDVWRTYVVKDDPEKIAKYNKNVSKASVLITFLLGILVMILTIDPPDIIFFLNLFAMGGLECSFFWPLVGGLFWKKGTGKAALASAVGAAATYVFCYYNVKVAGINAVVWGLLAGAVIYFLVGNLTIGDGLPEDVLENCF
jgi:sodium/pantothenate symporter